ncbi:MAG TPA: CBS domain-containing protein [Actinobacteria bacterium]|nr:CBS domain-containing protein [Actinomycetota bacterium]
MPAGRDPRSDIPVVWSRGPGCRELAALLTGNAVQVDGDPVRSCVRTRALLYVARRVTGFDACSTAVPSHFDPDGVREVAAFVGRGPHSPLAAAVALRIAHRLGVPARGVYAHAEPGPVPPAGRVLPEISERFPSLPIDAVPAAEPADLVGSLPAGCLFVLGAPGGSWLQRRFFGPGAKILHRAPAGTVVVKQAPRRVYQVMDDPEAYGTELRVADAVALGLRDVVVAVGGRPVGVVDSAALGPDSARRTLGELARPVPFVDPLETVDEASELFADAAVDVLPVVAQGRFLGVFRRAALEDPALPWAG